MRSYDLIVIGSGPAGERGATQAASFGKSVALIEREVVPGGAGVNTGTIPSKTLRESALHISGFKQRGLYGINVTMPDRLTVDDFMQRKREVVEKEWDMIEENMRWHGIDRYRGVARFASPHEITVDTAGYDVTLSGEFILIATGSSPHRPANVPFDDLCIYDSDSILNLDRIPDSLTVVGAGVIGCEYASIFAALGISVTLIDGRTELLSHVDREIVDVLMREMRNRWRIQFHLGQDVEEVVPGKSNVRLKLKGGREITAEKLLYAAGRQSNTADLHLDIPGVETGKRGVILVDEHYRTNVPHVYAAGDVIGFPGLAATSMEQARAAIVHAFNLQRKTKLAPLLPYGIYTIPELAMIGKTEENCLEEGIDYEVGRAYYRNNARGQIMGDTAGMLKIVFNPQNRKLMGIHIIGENSTDLIHVGMMVMLSDGTLDIFTQSVFNYPTLSDIYKYAAYDGLGRLTRRQKQRELVLSEAQSIARRLARRQREKQRRQKEAEAQKTMDAPATGDSSATAAAPDSVSDNGAKAASVPTEAIAVQANAPSVKQ
ncbi:MAG: Si-specific NAD(P)(+) transhydrogenase [Armatimonadota bacterium]|nr:Si-specific NAD(P)(+) transhydrogenase [Armatimonadota bacterium]